MCADTKPAVRDCYLYNPRVTTPAGNPPRAYQKTTEVHQLDVFIMDYMNSADGGNGTGMPFTPSDWAQYPSKGVESAFTDGSVKFAEFTPALFTEIATGLWPTGQSSSTSYNQFITIENFIQNAP